MRQGSTLFQKIRPKALAGTLGRLLRPSAPFSIFALIAGLSTGCLNGAQSISTGSVRGCQIGADQYGTLRGRWPALAVPIAFHTNDWDSSSVQPLIRAADSWNTHSNSVYGVNFIDYGSAAQLRTLPEAIPADLCGQEYVANGRFSHPVIIYGQNPWPYPDSPDEIARTTVCARQVGGQRFEQMHSVVIEINRQNFFASGMKQPDMQSVVTHELGHLLGLRHSCENAPKVAGMPTCGNSLYRSAVMYETFSYNGNAGEVRRTLNSNDLGRLNCLYTQ